MSSAQDSTWAPPKYFIYHLNITSASPTTAELKGKVKHAINWEDLLAREDCFHNEAAYVEILKKLMWSNNYTSEHSITIFDCHFIEYFQVCDGIEFNIKILFFTLKPGKELSSSVLKSSLESSDLQIINIYTRHFKITNMWDDYKASLFSKDIVKGEAHQWTLEYEDRLPLLIPITKHKLFPMSDGSVYVYDREVFMQREDFPKTQVYGGIIIDESHNRETRIMDALKLALSKSIRTLIVVPNDCKNDWQFQMTKYFAGNPFDGRVVLVSIEEATQMSSDTMAEFQRLIVDQLENLYSMKHLDNWKLFNTLCNKTCFQYRWGITTTPFIDTSHGIGYYYNSMPKILRFLTGKYDMYGYSYNLEVFKTLFIRNV